MVAYHKPTLSLVVALLHLMSRSPFLTYSYRLSFQITTLFGGLTGWETEKGAQDGIARDRKTIGEVYLK